MRHRSRCLKNLVVLPQPNLICGFAAAVFRINRHCTTIILRPGRAALLADHKGVVQTDGYAGYDFLAVKKDIFHAGCWAHARRKFAEAVKGAGKEKKPGSVDVALGYIRRIYEIETEGKRLGYSAVQFVELRQRKAKPILDDFFKWLSKKSLQVVPKSLLGIL